VTNDENVRGIPVSHAKGYLPLAAGMIDNAGFNVTANEEFESA